LKLYKTFWKCNDNKVISEDLKLQNSNWSYVPTIPCLWPLHLEKTYFVHSFINLSDYFWIRCTIWRFTKPFGSAKIIEWCPKILSSRIQIGHMCQPTSCPWPPLTWKRHILLIPSSIWGIIFTFDAQFEPLENLFEVKRQKNDIQIS
jgi:hypothetical protein